MRIIAGRWGGRRLAALGRGDTAAHLRPTPDRVRESLFSMLTHRDVVEGARVLDLFAGTGAMALEALSRGAIEAVLVEKGRVGQRLISDNIRALGATTATLFRGDATGLRSPSGPGFDLVFLDPPYGKGLGEKALASCLEWCTPGATVVWEEERPMDAPAGYQLLEQRQFGGVWVTLLQRW